MIEFEPAPALPTATAAQAADYARALAEVGPLAAVGAWFLRAGLTSLEHPRLLLAGDPSDSLSPVAAELAAQHSLSARHIPLVEAEPWEGSLAAGMAAVDAAVDEGCELIIPAPARRDRLGAATAMALLGAIEPVVIIGTSAPVPLAQWQADVQAVRTRRFQLRHLISQPQTLGPALADPVLAALVGCYYRCAQRRTPALVDHELSAVALAFADALAPGTASWVLAVHGGHSPAHHRALNRVGLSATVAVPVTAAGGIGSILALPALRGAVDLVRSYQVH